MIIAMLSLRRAGQEAAPVRAFRERQGCVRLLAAESVCGAAGRQLVLGRWSARRRGCRSPRLNPDPAGATPAACRCGEQLPSTHPSARSAHPAPTSRSSTRPSRSASLSPDRTGIGGASTGTGRGCVLGRRRCTRMEQDAVKQDAIAVVQLTHKAVINAQIVRPWLVRPGMSPLHPRLSAAMLGPLTWSAPVGCSRGEASEPVAPRLNPAPAQTAQISASCSCSPGKRSPPSSISACSSRSGWPALSGASSAGEIGRAHV